jgi:signal transduction histidine kinase/GAF domain-containing protein/CheY-like chemotaxis protein
MELLVTGGAPANDRVIETTIVRPDGGRRSMQTIVFCIPSNQGFMSCSISRDMTEKKKVEETLHRQLTELEVLYENGLSISRLLEPREIARRMIEILTKKLEWHHAAIRLYHPKTEQVELLALNQPDLTPDEIQAEIDRLNKIVTRPGKGLSGWVIKHGKTIRTGDVLSDKRYIQTFPDIRSGIYVPILLGDRALGSIAVESSKENRFTEEDERLLKTLAAQSAIAFENARLYQEAVRAADRRAILHRASQEITAAGLDLEAVYLAIHRAAAELIPVEAFFISLYDRDKQEAEGVYMSDRGQRCPNIRTSLGEGIAGRVIQTRKTLRIKDLAKEKWIKPVLFGKEISHAVLAVPMFTGAEVTGVISGQSYQPDLYEEEDETLLEMLAGYASTSIENARLFEQTRRHAAELGTLAQVSANLRTAVTRAEMLPIILDQVVNLFNAVGAVLAFRDPATDEVVVELANGGLVPLMKMRIPPGAGASGVVARTGQPYLSHNVFSDKNVYLPENMPQLRDMAFIPLVAREEIVGTLVMGKATEISEEEVKMLSAIADIAASAIWRAALHEQAIRHAEQMSAVNEIGRILAETLDLPAIYRRLTDAVYRLLPDICTVFTSLYNDVDEQIVCVCGHADGMFIDHEELLPIKFDRSGKGRQSQVITTREPLIANDLAENPSSAPHIRADDPAARTAQAGLFVPMIAQGKAIGVLQVKSYTRNRFGESEQELMNLVANTAAISIENARQYAIAQQELTERKRAEIRLDEAVRFAYATIDALPEHICVLDENGAILAVNRAWHEFAEANPPVPANHFEGMNYLEVCDSASGSGEEEARSFAQGIRSVMKGESEHFKLEYTCDSPEEQRWFLAKAMRFPGDGPVRLVVSHENTTERKQAEIALREARSDLEQRVTARTMDLTRVNAELARAMRTRDEFLANMSHELRTPLNAILGISESLEEQVVGPLNEKQQKYIRTVSESGHHLLTLINDILDLSKIEAGRMVMDLQNASADSLLQSSLRMVKELALKKGQNIALNSDGQVKTLYIDERRIKSALVNLLSNAVKFTPPGGNVGLEISGEANLGRATITVSDTGIGIGAEDLPHLFQPFVQLDAGLSREHTGTGLGLALVAQIVRLHGGRVDVQSNPGEGSRFSIILPWNPGKDGQPEDVVTEAPPALVAPVAPAQKGKILLIEDTESVIFITTDYLVSLGHEVIVARDGVAGVAEAVTQHPDLIFMDIQMPGMDGYTATRQIRNDQHLARTPIIALTAMAMPGDKERCLAAGMNDYLSKPVGLKELARLVEYHLRAAQGDAL